MKIDTEKIKEEIRRKKLKQKDVALQLEMDEAALSAAFKRGGLSDDRVFALAKLLQVDYTLIIPGPSIAEEPLSFTVSDTRYQYDLTNIYKEKFNHCQEELKMAKELIEQLKRDQQRSDEEINNLKGIPQKERKSG